MHMQSVAGMQGLSGMISHLRNQLDIASMRELDYQRLQMELARQNKVSALMLSLPSRDPVLRSLFQKLIDIPNMGLYQYGSSVKGSPFYSQTPSDYDFLICVETDVLTEMAVQIIDAYRRLEVVYAINNNFSVYDGDGLKFDLTVVPMCFQAYWQTLLWRAASQFACLWVKLNIICHLSVSVACFQASCRDGW